MTHIYKTEGGWNIEVEYSYHKGTTPAGGDDPESVSILLIREPLGRIWYEINIPAYCKAYLIDLEDIEIQILDENR